MFIRSIIIIFICLVGTLQRAQAQKVVKLTTKQSEIILGDKVAILEDSTQRLSLLQVLKPKNQQRFKPSKDKYPNFGFSHSHFWVKLKLQNQTQPQEQTLESVNQWFLKVAYAPIDYIEFHYQDKSGKWQKRIWGDHVPFANRLVFHPQVVIPFHLTDSQVHTYYLKVYTQGSLQLPLVMQSNHRFNEANMVSEIVFGVLYGVMAIMLMYNLFIFLAIRSYSYLFYCLYILSYLLGQSTLNGHSFQFLWGDYPWWANVALPFSITFGSYCAVLFAIRFLQTYKYVPRWNVVLIGFSVVLFFMIIVTFTTDYQISIITSTLSVMTSSVLMLLTGILVWRRGNRAAKYYIMAWTIVLIGLFMVVLKPYGFLPNHFLVDNANQVGAVIEVIFLSLALADRINIYRKETIEAQAEALATAKENERIITEQNQVLEQKVQERTSEITAQNEELFQQQEEIMAQRDAVESANLTLKDQATELEYAKKSLEEKTIQLNKSLEAAFTIQNAILPYEKELAKLVDSHFLLYSPKDIVSGDFYWLHKEQEHNKTFLAAVDCTGHGVPGAFMSLIGSTLLDRVVKMEQVFDPAEILGRLNEEVLNVLRHQDYKSDTGMDVCLCVLEYGEHTQVNITYAGARRPLYFLRDATRELEEIKGDRIHVGGVKTADRTFTNHEFTLFQGDNLYLTSDGYIDQNDLKRKKIGRKRFNELLQSVGGLPMNEQYETLLNTLKTHMEGTEQRDDILVMGVKL
ncbi:7TM diverse intracellular signaling domain-containing protein [uncultured Microscilla sp.]|uniref:7TM diverse intracellular signaling domain-containing protein n=1 Tax=uncultured Microscilla sp. TaxID=432653 RepID=UPI0026041E6C|nr:7TM diverse intracellular signaling domain-containing protein [uncultured Microscilla sp.]